MTCAALIGAVWLTQREPPVRSSRFLAVEPAECGDALQGSYRGFREACACGWKGWGIPAGRYVGIAVARVPLPVNLIVSQFEI
jgi:hypothetical protein